MRSEEFSQDAGSTLERERPGSRERKRDGEMERERESGPVCESGFNAVIIE